MRLRAARERFAAGGLAAADLHAIEDECIREVVQAAGERRLEGDHRRRVSSLDFHIDFLERLEGVETRYGEFVAKFRR